jgi:hypothetical protein
MFDAGPSKSVAESHRGGPGNPARTTSISLRLAAPSSLGSPGGQGDDWSGALSDLTGIMFDTDSRTGKIFFVDPMGGKAGSVAIRQLDSSIITDYFISDELPTRIVGVIAESPVPEPATVLLLGSALILQGCGVRKRRRCRIWAPPSHQPRYFWRPRRSLAPSGGAFLPDRPATSLRPIAEPGPLARGK